MESQQQQTTFSCSFFFLEKRPNILCDTSARQTVHMKCYFLFSLENKKNIMECRLLQFRIALYGLI